MDGVVEEDDEQQADTSTESAHGFQIEEPPTRRARLAALSNRMKKEFEHAADTATDEENWMKNLHPWHKRILFKPESPNESPTESPNGLDSPSRSRNCIENSLEGSYLTPTTSKYESPQMIESVSRRARLAAMTNKMRKEFDSVPEASADENDSVTRSLQPFYRRVSSRPETPVPSSASQEVSPINPPPSEPPPPLPAMELRSPPPLPPRNPSIQLPMPTPVEQTTPPESLTSSSSNNSRQLPANSAESVCAKSEENGKVDDNTMQKKRGHMKTLSLDRDFTMAKSLRSSPFQPTSNKSNSLTRQAGAEQEEELRIIEAEGVINEITSDLQITEKEILESNPSSSASFPVNGSLDKPKTFLAKVDESGTTDGELESPVKKITIEGSSATLPISDHRLNLPSASPKAPLDPISRDVERRLSMKVDRSLMRELPDDSLSGHSSIRSSSIDHAKVLAKTASNYASSIFRGAINKVKQVAHSGSHSSNENDEETTDSDGEHSEAGNTATSAVVRPRKTKKGPFDFQHLKIVQEINNEHTGAVWCIKFSACGRLLATAGADCILRVWCLTTHVQHFQGMRERYQQKMDYDAEFAKKEPWETFEAPSSSSSVEGAEMDPMPIFAPKPFASYKGHVADILDLSWSKNYFILSSGMDRTAKLWHISRNECLCCFQHQDFVTSVSFLPKDDRYFVSGSLDGRMRIWNIPEKKVVFWNEVEEKLITALTFVKNGKFIVVGTYYGKCYFYTSELKYHTVISTRGKGSMGNKVTGLSVHGDKLLVTFNDSRIHMYDIRDKVLICKFRGAQHERSQIRASFSPDGRHVVCGSEDKFIYLWRTSDAQATRRDRNSMWERVRAHKTTVTVALFAPDPQLFLSNTEKRKGPQPNTNVIASADLDGSIKLMLNRATPKETLIPSLPLEPVPEVVDPPLADNRTNSLPKVNF